MLRAGDPWRPSYVGPARMVIVVVQVKPGRRAARRPWLRISNHACVFHTPTDPVYPLNDSSDGLELAAGTMVIGGREVEGRITLDSRDRGGVHWQADASSIAPFDLGPATLAIDPPAAVLRVAGDVQVSSSLGRGRLLPVEVGEASALLHEVIIHWLNLPDLAPLHADVLRYGGTTWAGRRTLEGGGWKMTFDARPDLAETLRAVDERDALVTHIGLLRRTDGGSF